MHESEFLYVKCAHKTNEGKQVPNIHASKLFELNEVIDESMFGIDNLCKCGYEINDCGNVNIILSKTIATDKTKVIYTYDNKEYQSAVPLNSYVLEAENCNIENDISNYQVSYIEYEIEGGV